MINPDGIGLGFIVGPSLSGQQNDGQSRIQATTPLNENYVFTLTSRPTPTQKRAFELLGITPDCTQ